MYSALLSLFACRPPDTEQILSSWQAPPDGISEPLWADATEAWARGIRDGHSWSTTLGLVDFSLPSTALRLWIVDLESQQTLLNDRVAHGSGSGDLYARSFSDEPGSHASSLGLYRATWPYQGKNGRSLRLEGLDPSNRSALSRAIVIHPSRYMDDTWIATHGRPGRSWGCFAVDPDISDTVINTLKGSLLFAWSYP